MFILLTFSLSSKSPFYRVGVPKSDHGFAKNRACSFDWPVKFNPGR
jgi:hypothetical protein